MTFYNISNHPSSAWSEEQLQAASKWGEIVDVPFPNVPPEATEDEVHELGRELLGQLPEVGAGDALLIQGEFTLVYALVTWAKACGYTALAACSERQVVENLDGTKTVKFDFIRFRKY